MSFLVKSLIATRSLFRWNGDLDLIAYPARPRDGHDYLGAAGMSHMYPGGGGGHGGGMRRDAVGARSRTPSPLGREGATAGGAGPSSNPNLPPLREIIWRRLRRRNAQLNMLEEQAAEELRAAAAVSQWHAHAPRLHWLQYYVPKLTVE